MLGFAQNLMALGLGEPPAELAESPAEIAVPPRVDARAETVAAPMGWVEEAVEPLGVAPQAAQIPEVTPTPEPVEVSEVLLAPELAEVPADDQFAGLAESFELSPYAAAEPAAEPADEATPDFAELLGSLDYEEATPAVAPETSGAAVADSPYEAMPDATLRLRRGAAPRGICARSRPAASSPPTRSLKTSRATNSTSRAG